MRVGELSHLSCETILEISICCVSLLAMLREANTLTNTLIPAGGDNVPLACMNQVREEQTLKLLSTISGLKFSKCLRRITNRDTSR